MFLYHAQLAHEGVPVVRGGYMGGVGAEARESEVAHLQAESQPRACESQRKERNAKSHAAVCERLEGFVSIRDTRVFGGAVSMLSLWRP